MALINFMTKHFYWLLGGFFGLIGIAIFSGC